MTTIQLINYICNHPEYGYYVIQDEYKRRFGHAIERLSSDYDDERNKEWIINGQLETDTLIMYQQ